MFTVPWKGRLTTVKAIGKAGAEELRIQFVAPAEDAMLQIDQVGTACRQAYKLVKAGKTGTIPVKMPKRWLCKMECSYENNAGKATKLTLKHVVPEKLAIVATEKETEPPKIRMDLTCEYTDKEALHLLRAFKRDCDVDISPADGGKVLPFDTEKAA
jgi:hypothetical protein